jgi:hypothetical protein
LAPENLAGEDGWQAEPEAALIAGQLTDWDDFQVGSPCIVPVDKGWRMYFEGARLDEDGLSQAIGVAQSDDGRTWRKHENNPVIAAESPEELRHPTKRLLLPAVCRLPDDSWLMTCTETDQNHGTSRLRVLRSADGFDWESAPDSEADLMKAASESKLFSPSFCASPLRKDRIQLWCLKKGDSGNIRDVTKLNIVMLQTVDGKTWKQLSERPFTEIEPKGFVWYMRFAVDGVRWVFSYPFTVRDSSDPALIRLRRSADGIRWTPLGLPDFVFPTHQDDGERTEISRPGLLLGPKEVRFFFTEQQADGTRRILSAFFSRQTSGASP